MEEFTPDLFAVDSLTTKFGPAKRASPLSSSFLSRHFVSDTEDRILVDITLKSLVHSWRPEHGNIVFSPPSFELAGPRDCVFWNPKSTKVAIVTCGGLAPGLNNVIQSLVKLLHDVYEVQNIYGVPFGFFGFAHDPDSKKFRFGWHRLDPVSMQNIDNEAGSFLGSSRGHSDPSAIVDALVIRDINILFTIGGEGTLAGAHAICDEITKRNLPIAVVGIPKTIDNDVPWVSKSFGFETAVAKGVEALHCAQAEARSAFHGIGLVKLMGRHSGALTATAAAAMPGIDFVLIPEVELVLEGEKGFLAHVVKRVVDHGHATIAVAEGAGQNLFLDDQKSFDASGNVKLNDIGKLLKTRITEEFKRLGIESTLKYIEPSYMLRAQTTSADDSIFCATLGQHAAHAAMAGKTSLMIGYAHGVFTHVPFRAVRAFGQKRLDTNDPLWLSILASTGQPAQWL